MPGLLRDLEVRATMAPVLTYQFMHLPTHLSIYPSIHLLTHPATLTPSAIKVGVCFMDPALLATGDQGLCLSWELTFLRQSQLA